MALNPRTCPSKRLARVSGHQRGLWNKTRIDYVLPSKRRKGLLFGEDGMAPALYSDLRKLLIMIMQFMYLLPYMFSSIPTIISSGSTTQSEAIGSKASALQINSTPAHLADKKNVLAYRAKFFRCDRNCF